MTMDFETVYCVVNPGQGARVLKLARQYGVRGGAVYPGQGTAKSKLLEFLDLNDSRKEIVLMLIKQDIAGDVTDLIAREMAFQKSHHGIAFSVPIKGLLSRRNHIEIHPREEVKTVCDLIYAVVEKGKGQDAVDAAKTAGAKGGTIVNARGSWNRETETVFAMPIEPEKEIVMILAEPETSDAIAHAIYDRLEMGQLGNGLLFVQGVTRTYGL